ncbi:type I-C CRISPR-associated endonuclease Cas1c [Roseiconus lacunae]|uniref:type I-C CRISPR-associated endonuclease Cas1c n=1 Tax=Roseiconus lacunae TaxID=2605694 RepID=UPI00308DF9EC|nr:type I-C CRISPR-associated endonuclease Cas1c [Stieleria sp. HD01]
MKTHLNTLFVMTQGAYLRKQSDAVVVRVEKKDVFRVPLLNLDGIVCFGRVSVSPFLLGACADRGLSVSLMTRYGRLMASVNGFTRGNVLLRREQYRRADVPELAASLARSCVIGKLANFRTLLRRAARETKQGESKEKLSTAARRIAQTVKRLATPETLDVIRGIEGDASRVYFSVFDHLIRRDDDDFRFTVRSRRPPKDAINAMLSFAYALLSHDVRSACEAAGLDAAVGCLHRDRPGRPGLALDLMEELRPVIVDRVVLSLVNRRQVHSSGFTTEPTGGVRMDDKTRKLLLAEYQKRKQEEITHPFLDERMSLGLVPHLQARLYARVLRDDLDAYPPFAWR